MTQVIYLHDYDWLIKIFYVTDKLNPDIILNELDQIDCPTEIFYSAAELLESPETNLGLTFSDTQKHVTFIIIGQTDCAKEFLGTYIHEIGHAASHIFEYYNLNPYAEEYQYLVGEIAMESFNYAKEFLCDSCRNKKGDL